MCESLLAKTLAPTHLPIWTLGKTTFAQFPLSNHGMGSLWFECLCLNQYHHEFLNILCLNGIGLVYVSSTI
jgi:hypothetical protein